MIEPFAVVVSITCELFRNSALIGATPGVVNASTTRNAQCEGIQLRYVNSLQHAETGIARAGTPLAPGQDGSTKQSSSHSSRRLKVLVVDDEPMIREVLVAYLKEQGHHAESAINGAEGLDKYQQGLWDVVLTDGLMPDMNGKELAVAIKAINPKTPVFLVSGSADLLHKAGDQESPIDLVIRKPFTRQTVTEALSTVSAP